MNGERHRADLVELETKIAELKTKIVELKAARTVRKPVAETWVDDFSQERLDDFHNG